MKLLQQQQTTGPSPEAVATTCPGAIAATKKLLRLVLKHLLQQQKKTTGTSPEAEATTTY